MSFCMESRPGFYFVPGALSVEEQCSWIRESLTSFPQPPNRTNHNAIYGSTRDLFVAAKERKVLVEHGNGELYGLETGGREFCEEREFQSRKKTGKYVLAAALLRKLRWSTLGLQFDWSKRNYNASLPHNEIPDALCQLAKGMACYACGRRIPARGCNSELFWIRGYTWGSP